MTPTELAAALRKRFLLLRKDFPDFCTKARLMRDDLFIDSHLRCAACHKTHTPKAVALEIAVKHGTLEPWLQEMERLALRTWPRRCTSVIKVMHASIPRMKPD